MEFNYYEILGVRADASDDEIKSAYKTLAKRYHPDKHAGNTAFEEHFKKINSAYQTLSDSEKRKRYDLKLYYQSVRKNESSRPVTNVTTRPNANKRNPNPIKKTPANSLDKKTKRKYATIVIIALVGFIALSVWFYMFMNKAAAKDNLKEGIALEKDKPRWAMEYYTEAISFDAHLTEAYLRRAKLRISLYQDYQGALADLDLAIINAPEPDYLLYFQRAKYHVKNKDREKGIDDLNKAIELNPKYDSLYFYRAEINNYLLKNYEASIKDYNKTIELKKDFKDARFGKAIAEFNLNDYENSIKDFDALIKSYPQEGSYYYYRGFVKMNLKDSANACRDWELAVMNSFNEAHDPLFKYCIKKR